MGIIQDTIRRYLDKGYAKRVIIMGLDHSGKTTTMKGLINDYTYIKMIPGECSNTYDHAFSYYQLYDRFEPLDWYVYGAFDTRINTETKYSDAFTDMVLNDVKYRIDHYYPDPLFVMYLHDMFMDEEAKRDHYDVIANKVTILNRYLEIIKRYCKYYPFIVITERSFKLLGKGAIYDYGKLRT